MSHDPPKEEAARACLRLALFTLAVETTAALIHADWTDPEEAARIEKRVRVLSVHRTTLEKISMDDAVGTGFTAADTARLREELYGRLSRHADRLGIEELSRRLRARGIDPDSARVGPLGTVRPAAPGR